MNLRDIAALARVSTATVSRALNRVPTVDPRLARRVWQIVDELNYYPNNQARALVLGRSRTFGLVIAVITDSFFAEVLQGFVQLAVQNRYEVLLGFTSSDPTLTHQTVRRMIERRVEGVAILVPEIEEGLIEPFLAENIPVVLSSPTRGLPGACKIVVDYRHGIQQAVHHLAALRHRRIAFISGPSCSSAALEQRDAFGQSMREIGLTVLPELVVSGDLTAEFGKRALRQLMADPVRPTAILCSKDITAFGVLAQARDCGLAVPEDLSIIGTDDVHLSRFTLPPLTTNRISPLELATLAVRELIDQIRGQRKAEPKFAHVITPNLVVRQSTRLLRAP